MKMTIDIFIALKKKHGKLTGVLTDEGGEFKEWKHEYGYPERFHALLFKDGAIWDVVCGERGTGTGTGAGL